MCLATERSHKHLVLLKYSVLQPLFTNGKIRIPPLGREGKEMLYLTTHSTHFFLRLYDVGHMVKDHSDSERGNPLLPHRQQGFFYMHHPTDRITHTTTAFVTPVVEHWLEGEIHLWDVFKVTYCFNIQVGVNPNRSKKAFEIKRVRNYHVTSSCQLQFGHITFGVSNGYFCHILLCLFC